MTTKVPVELSSTPGIADSSNATAITIDSSENTTFSGDVEVGTTAPKINLKNTDTSIVADQSLGVIEVESSDGSTGSAGTIAKLDIAASGAFDGSGHGSEFRFTVGATNQSGSIALTEAMRITSTANVLIGNTDGSGILNINNGANDGGYVHFANNVGATTLTNDRGLAVGWNKSNGQGESVIIANQGGGTTGGLVFATNTSAGSYNERMRITSSGQVFVGRTSSVDAGLFIVSANPSTYNHITTIPEANASYNALTMTDYVGNRLGAISVGTTSTSITYGGTSDYRLKENIVPMEKGLERVNKLKPVKFDWKSDGTTSEGFIAHEIQEAGWVLGVTGEKDDEEMQMVDYGKLTPLLVKAIQEQQELIETLTARIETLEGGE